jgi:hypothetical protein
MRGSLVVIIGLMLGFAFSTPSQADRDTRDMQELTYKGYKCERQGRTYVCKKSGSKTYACSGRLCRPLPH